jgi:hypothetical protein
MKLKVRRTEAMSQTQFSIRTLLAAIAAVGIGAALWVAEPSWQLGVIEALVLAWITASAVLLTANSIGLARAWWAGIAAESMLAIIFVIPFFPRSLLVRGPFDSDTWVASYLFKALSSQFHLLLIAWAFAPVVGLLCVFTHWLLIRPPEPKA